MPKGTWVEGRVYQILKQSDFQRSHLKTIVKLVIAREREKGGKGVCVCVCVCVSVSVSVCVYVCAAQLCPTLCNLLCPWNSPGKNPGVGCHSHLQGTFLIRGSNTCLLHVLIWQVDSLPLCHLGSLVT